MSLKDRTKIMFADELEKMAESMPLSKIRVVELCKRCGTTPPTFYYHFRDKYELVAWMFLRDFADVVGDRTPGYSADELNAIMSRMEKRRVFYRKAYGERSQNSINRYIQDFNVRISTDAVKRYRGADEISPEETLAIKYHSYGVQGLFQEWLFGDAKITLEEMARFNFERTPDFLKEAFEVYPYSKSDILLNVGKYQAT